MQSKCPERYSATSCVAYPGCCSPRAGRSPSATPPPTGPIAAHVTHYDYTFDLDSRAAHATVSAVVDTAGDCITLPFRAASPDSNTLRVDGQPAASAMLAGGMLTVCGGGDDVGDTLTLDVDESVALATLAPTQVGYSMQNDRDGNPFYYLVSWVNGCDQFGPCDSRPDQFATFHFTVTHQAGVIARCPGDITETSPTQTECDFEHPGGPTYSTFGVAASPAWMQTDEGMWGDVHVTLYDRASTGIAAAIDTSYHDGFITFMEATFGPYPFGSDLRVLTAPTYWNGFEHPGNIVLGDFLKTQTHPPYFDNVAHTLDHEMTHMWAGDQTTIAGTYDFAWKESMAEYLPFTYEDTTGGAAVSSRTSGYWKEIANAAMYFPVPDDMPALVDYYGDVYGAGPMILFRQVEALSSRAQVIAGLQTLLGTPRAISVDDVVAALAASTGLDLTDYAKAWLHGTGTPAWPQMQTSFDATTGMLTVHQTNQATGVRGGCAFHVQLVGASAGDTQLVAVDTFHGGPDQTIAVTPAPSFAVTSIALDPQNECLVFPASLSRGERMNPWVAP